MGNALPLFIYTQFVVYVFFALIFAVLYSLSPSTHPSPTLGIMPDDNTLNPMTGLPFVATLRKESKVLATESPQNGRRGSQNGRTKLNEDEA